MHGNSNIKLFVFCSCDDNKKPVFQNEEAFRNVVTFEILKYTDLFMNTSFYILAVLLDTPGTNWGSQTTAFLMYASNTAVCEDHISTLKSVTLRSSVTSKSSKDAPLHTRLQIKNFLLHAIKKNIYKVMPLKREPIFSYGNRKPGNEDGGRILLGENRRQGGHAADDQVPVFWNVGFNWTPLCTSHNWPHVHSMPTCAQFDLRRPFQDINIA